MRYWRGTLIGACLVLGGCSVFDPPVGYICRSTIYPRLGTSYEEFLAEVNQCLLRPEPITSPGNVMIYTIPGDKDTLYWFKNGQLTKVTRRNPDDYNAWSRPVNAPRP
jgi:hypothetical protein